MRIVIASSERFAGCMVHALSKAGHDIVGVISPYQGIYERQFDGLRFVFYDWLEWDMRKACERFKVPLRVSRDLKDGAIQSFFYQTKPELLVVFGWPKLIDEETLSQFSRGGLNIHPSLLPKMRGADPLFSLVDHYELNFGISIHKLEPELDAGNLYLQEPLDFSPNHTYDDLYLKFIRAIHRHLPTAVRTLSNNPVGIPQSGTPSYVSPFRGKKRFLNLTMPAEQVKRRALACDSHHPMVSTLNGLLFSFKRCTLLPTANSNITTPGTILNVGLFSMSVRLTDAIVKLSGIRFLSKPTYLVPHLLVKHGRHGELIGSLKQTKIAWRAWRRTFDSA